MVPLFTDGQTVDVRHSVDGGEGRPSVTDRRERPSKFGRRREVFLAHRTDPLS